MSRFPISPLVIALLAGCWPAPESGTTSPAEPAPRDTPMEVADPWADPSAPPAPSAAADPSTTRTSAHARALTFNGKQASARDLEILARFESAWGVQVPAGDYWYDDTSGAAGVWDGPTRGFLGAGLGLGGVAVPASASGGGNGRTTGVFINGRELHPLDVQGLTAMFGQPPLPGRWWVDGQGNFGAEGQPALGNLIALASARNQRSGGGNSYYRSDVGTGSSVFVGSGCAAVSGRTSPSDSDSSYSYYVGCE